MLWTIKTILHAIFRIVFTLEYQGVENVPPTGAVVLAGNHPSYLDPMLISLPIRREIRFIAWDKLFKVPILGSLLRFFGAFPVDVTRRDARAFEQSMDVLRAGYALGIFPEAGRSKQGRMNELLKTGAARFAIHNACPLVPITITGAYDAWPASRPLPLPRKITVKYHPPIILDAEECARRRDDPNFALEVTERLRVAVEQRLLPSLKVTEKLYELFARPAWPLRIYEMVPFVALLVALVWGNAPKPALVLPPIAYYAYLLADLWAIPQGRITKALRDLATPLLLVAWHPTLLRGFLAPTALEAFNYVHFTLLALVCATILFPFYYASYYDCQRFMRGVVLTYCATTLLERFSPETSGYGFHVALLTFAITYGADRRPLHWPFIVAGSALYLGMFARLAAHPWRTDLLVYALAGATVDVYMRAVKFTAHDGRTV
jgi:1-acyl-sn-glycerol-3-phosphate acyltransferase